MGSRLRFCLTMCLCAALATGANAQEKSQYTLFKPTPPDQRRDFNADRPTKVFVPWTVDAGHVQVEGDVFFYGYDNTSTPDTTITTWLLGNPTVKLGVLNNVDLQVNFAAFSSVRTQLRSDGSATQASGFGDVVTRAKINLFGNEGGGAALAVIPFAKWPTAPTGVGNRQVEGGIGMPLALPLPAGFTAIVMGEVDWLKNPNDSGYHVNLPAILNINRQIASGVTAFAEVYANWSTHRDVRDLYTLDFALAWSPRPDFQLDLGINIGLVPAAVPYQLYGGIAYRF